MGSRQHWDSFKSDETCLPLVVLLAYKQFGHWRCNRILVGTRMQPLVSNKIEIYIHVLHFLVKNMIDWHIICIDVITVECWSFRKWNTKFMKHYLKPNGFSCKRCKGPILCFGGRTNHYTLFLWTPRDEMRAKIYTEIASWLSIINPTSPIYITISIKMDVMLWFKK